MRNKILRGLVAWIAFPLLSFAIPAEEKIFADYFDIPLNSGEGTEVMGRIHLERNKDVPARPIPPGYQFEIVAPTDGLFQLDTRYDLSHRIMGVFSVAPGRQTGSTPSVHRLTVALKDGKHELKRFDVDIRVVKETLWSLFYKRYTPKTLKNKRLYGRIKYSDSEVASQIEELRGNEWKFAGLERCYQGRPQDYVAQFDSADEYASSGTIEYDWVEVANRIGGLGYAYATSDVYGPKGNPIKRNELKEALYQAILTYTRSVPVEGDDVWVDGKPIGHCTGDGFALLQAHKMTGMQTPTHQWLMTDPLVVPVLHLMPELLKGMQRQDETCLKVHDALIHYLQIFFAEIKSRRAIDDPDGRWGELQDTIYSSGAWADANLGHRSRTLLAMPIIWADYNRPLTYVPYWYTDFYHGVPFEGFSFSSGWSPHGVVSDVSYWMTKCNVEAHRYIQSGFQPDGTVSHHVGNATDAAMVAYGFEWLTDCNNGYGYLKNTEYKITDKHYQYQLDRLLHVYPKLFYKQRMDFLVAGRSFLDDLRAFTTKTYVKAVKSLLNAQNSDSRLEGTEALKTICQQIQDNSWEYSGTDAYWVNEYLVHRRGAHEMPFYASLKLKSERTVGAEDFSKQVRRSWHMGYGILQVKVKGDEYADKVLRNYDWHALPGLTEEWRTDPMPLGHSQASLPGANKIAGVLADGKAGMGIYHHLPRETYSSATAYKSYHFIEDQIVALGSGIGRLRPGQGNAIATFIDQTALDDTLTWCVGNQVHIVVPGQSVDLTQEIKEVCWLHHGCKGYVILPVKNLSLHIRSGQEVNITDRSIADKQPNFIIAIGHGANPGQVQDAAYRYVQLPNVCVEEMPQHVDALLNDLELTMQDKAVHAVYSKKEKTWQYAFFKPGNATVGNVMVTSDDVAQVMLRDNETEWVLAVGNPMPDGRKQTLTFRTTASLPIGVYPYQTKGVYPLEGETVQIEPDDMGCKVTVELPDSRDAAKYNYQSDLYAATPIVVRIPKIRQEPLPSRLDWWREARFGLFIHLGLYSVAAGEWDGKEVEGIGEWIQNFAKVPNSEYEKLLPSFTLGKCRPEEWAKLAKEAGAQYVVFTAKHHEGFCLYPSQVTDFDIERTPYPGDPLKELVEACRMQGLKVGIYYSHRQDWREEEAAVMKNEYDGHYGKPVSEVQPDLDRYLRNKALPQVRELLTNYGKIDVLWFDTPFDLTKEQSQAFVNIVRELQPDCLINGRVGYNLGDYGALGDNEMPCAHASTDLEMVATINRTWGYKKNDHDWKGGKDILCSLIESVSRDINYMVNIGPRADGVVPQPSVDVLHFVGNWLKQHGEAIYGANGNPFNDNLPWGYITRKGNVLYLHLTRRPQNNRIVLKGLQSAILQAEVLSTKQILHADGNRIDIPEGLDFECVPVVKLTCGSPLRVDPSNYVNEGIVSMPAASGKRIPGVEGCFTIAEGGCTYNFHPGTGTLQLECEIDEPGEYEVRLYTSRHWRRSFAEGTKVTLRVEDEALCEACLLQKDEELANVRQHSYPETWSLLGTVRFEKAGRKTVELSVDSVGTYRRLGFFGEDIQHETDNNVRVMRVELHQTTPRPDLKSSNGIEF